MIAIDDKYSIKMDTYNYILCVKQNRKGNEEEYVELTYHKTIQGLLRSYARRSARKRKPQTYDGLIRIMNQINKTIDNFIENITIEDVKKEYENYRKAREEYANLANIRKIEK